MDWKDFHQRMLNYALIATICFIPLQAFFTITFASLKLQTPQVLIHLASLQTIPETIAVITTCAALSAFAAIRGFTVFGWAALLMCCLWFTCVVIIYALTAFAYAQVTWDASFSSLNQSFIKIYEFSEAIRRVFSGHMPVLTLIILPCLLLSLRAYLGNSLLKLLTGPALPILFIAVVWARTPAIAVAVLSAGSLIFWHASEMKSHPVTVLFSLFSLLMLVSFANAAYKEVIVLTSDLPEHALQLGFSSGPGAAYPAVTFLAPLLAAVLAHPEAASRLKYAIPAIFGISLINWFATVFPYLRSGAATFRTIPDFQPIIIPGAINNAPDMYQPLFETLLLPTLWLANTLLILWCYLQVWKAR